MLYNHSILEKSFKEILKKPKLPPRMSVFKLLFTIIAQLTCFELMFLAWADKV